MSLQQDKQRSITTSPRKTLSSFSMKLSYLNDMRLQPYQMPWFERKQFLNGRKSHVWSENKQHVRFRSVAFPINPFAPGDFAEKRVLKLVEWFSGHCRAIKSYNLPQTSYRSYTSRPSYPDAKYQLAKFGHAQKAKFRDWFLGLKVTQQS